jgi:hypothetical protein
LPDFITGVNADFASFDRFGKLACFLYLNVGRSLLLFGADNTVRLPDVIHTSVGVVGVMSLIHNS